MSMVVPPRPARRRLVWWICGAVVVLLVVWLAACAYQIVRGIRDVKRGVDAASTARSEVTGSDLLAERPLGPLEQANADFSSARSHLDWPLVMPLRIVPWFGRQLHSVQSISSAAAQVTGVGSSAVRQAHAVLEGPHQAGPERVAALEQLSHIAASAYSSVRNVDLGPSDALIGPLARRRGQFASDLDRARSGLDHAAAVTSTVARLISGPTQYLLLAGNNAEMRSGSGMWLQAGVVTGDDGNVHIGPLTPTGDIPAPPGAVPLTGDFAARWGFLLPSQEWRNLGLTPQFDVNAPLAMQMWKAVTGQQVDGVVSVDVYALQQMLTVTGPITLAGQTITSSNAIQYLTQGQYASLGNSPSDEVQSARRDQLGDLARAALDAIQNQNVDLSALATALTNSAEGRHIMVWSPVPSYEAAWRSGGVAGQLTPDSLLSSVINRGGNKLDPYLSVSDNLQFHPNGGSTDATLTVHLANTAPAGPPSYALGPYPGLGASPGEYIGYMAFNVPAAAKRPEIQGYGTLVAGGPEGPTTLVAVPFDLMPGSSTDFVLRFRWPAPHGSVKIVPSARASPVPWQDGPQSFSDAAPRTVSW
jgi:hypothetical protein